MAISYANTSLLKSTTILGGGSLGTMLIGVVSAKAWAVLVGPGGLGHAALLQSVAALSGIVAGMGLASGIVRLGAASAAATDRRQLEVLVRAAWSLWAVGAMTCVAVLLAGSGLIAGWLGGDVRGSEVAVMGIVMAANAATTVQNGVINAYHRVDVLAWVTVLGAFLGNIVSIPLLAYLGVQYLTLALAANALAACAVSSWAYRQVHQPTPHAGDRAQLWSARGELLRFGFPLVVSTLFGAGIQWVLPILIAQYGSEAQIGYFRAASVIAITYVGFLLTALGQDYYPRLAAVRDNPAALILKFRQQFRFTVGLAAPLVLGMLLTSQWILPLCYSPQFSPALPLLDWFILGAFFKIVSCSLGYLILARCPGWVLLVTETSAGAVWLGTSWLGLRAGRIDGLGIAFAATYAVHSLVVGAVVARYVGWAMGRKQWLTLLLVVGLAGSLLAVKSW